MISDEKDLQKEEQRGPATDCDTKQETRSREAQGNSTGGSESPLGFVYFIEGPGGIHLKIGYSAHSVEDRFQQIACSLPGLRLLGHIPGTRATEKWLHAKFADQQEQGEWFRYDETLRIFIEHLGIVPAGPARISRRKVGRSMKSIRLHAPDAVPPENTATLLPESNATDSEHEWEQQPLTSNEWQARLGRNGGRSRAKSLTPERRQEIARKASDARWAEKRAQEAAALAESVTSAKKQGPKKKRKAA